MVLDKTLILKGIAAAGAVAGGGVSVAYGAGAFKSQEEKDKEAKENKKNEVNKKLNDLGLGDCHLVDDEVTSPTAFSKECQLTKDQFQAINFSNKPTTGNVAVGGWTNGNITLKIENKDQDKIKFTFKNPSSDLTITGDNTKGTITIKKQKETEFEENSEGKLSKVIDGTLKEKLAGINEKLRTLGLPDDCRFDDTEKNKSFECPLDEGKLKAIKFSNKGNGDLTVNGTVPTSGLKIKVEVKEGENDATFSFLGLTEDLTILGDRNEGKIVLKTSGGREFKEKEGKLEKVPSDGSLSTKLKKFNKKLLDLNVPDDCRFDEGEGDTSIECNISQDNLKKIKFSNKGNGELKVNNWGSNVNLKLKVEKKNDQGEIKFALKGSTSDLAITGEKGKGIITLKSGIEREFEIKDGALGKVPQAGVNSEKLKQHNQNLEKINLPQMCRFDEAENETKVTCSVSKEDLKKIKFWNKGSGDLTINPDASFTTANLEVKEEKGNNLKLVFKNVNKTVKITGEGNNSFNLRQSSDEFEIRSEVLGQVKKAGSEGDKLGLTCIYSGLGNTGTCKAKANTLKVSSGTTNGTVNITNTQDNIFNFSEYEDGYNLTTKFTYIGQTASGSNGLQLEKNSNYEGQNKESVWHLVKKNSK